MENHNTTNLKEAEDREKLKRLRKLYEKMAEEEIKKHEMEMKKYGGEKRPEDMAKLREMFGKMIDDVDREREKDKKREKRKTLNVIKMCINCGRVGISLKNCGGCGFVWYCNSNCQTNDWCSHKAYCKNKKKEKEKEKEKQKELKIELEKKLNEEKEKQRRAEEEQRRAEEEAYEMSLMEKEDARNNLILKLHTLESNWFELVEEFQYQYMNSKESTICQDVWSQLNECDIEIKNVESVLVKEFQYVIEDQNRPPHRHPLFYYNISVDSNGIPSFLPDYEEDC